ncbi:response regulator [Hellea sp.]|nr:response regulator [Hellea sp.]
MSPDDIFAAQMWPWPEPALKRDTMGRVLFVNAAFLQMYGGQVEDWRGNIVTGWPAPQPPGMPYRFETRLPTEEGEQVYDWMELTMADGNAFAMARNVTYLFQTPDPDPGNMQHPAEVEQAVAANAPQTAAAMHTPNLEESLPVFAEQPPVHEVTQQDTAPEYTPADSYAAESHQLAENMSADIAADPVFDASSYDNLADTSVAETAPIAPAAEPVAVNNAPEERDFERRALPIENQDAVLGNNWRDAVIAKAVGAKALKAEEPQPETPAPEGNEETGSGSDTVRILLAEDNAINALLTRTLLEAEGHSVDTVEDGALAVEAMKSAKYDLIFMDMRMPNMDGLEATRKIRAMDNVSKGLPIIALTANAFDDDRNACFDSGMNDFMTKPVSAEELSEMVRTWTKNKAERDAA